MQLKALKSWSTPFLCTVNSRSIITGQRLTSDSYGITPVCNQSERDICTINSFWDAGRPCTCDRALPVSLGAAWLWDGHSWSDNHLGIYLSGFPPQPNSEWVESVTTLCYKERYILQMEFKKRSIKVLGDSHLVYENPYRRVNVISSLVKLYYLN